MQKNLYLPTINKMNRRNKFDAAKEFTAGVKQAMFPGDYRGDKYNWNDELFNAGYEYGRTLHDEYYQAMNAALADRGIQSIAMISSRWSESCASEQGHAE